ncbi:hypothetical protein GBAR_LOCUS16244 [Geodia barretti]|uniref:Uncharacterized protein n=1 Tax=Geodia barretti TaxID=519541 RepID=A0AA35SGZ4_GEOBA|nr:hypothetical protein GBAR_LOCUS16244 [Geodia barretti]
METDRSLLGITVLRDFLAGETTGSRLFVRCMVAGVLRVHRGTNHFIVTLVILQLTFFIYKYSRHTEL